MKSQFLEGKRIHICYKKLKKKSEEANYDIDVTTKSDKVNEYNDKINISMEEENKNL